MTFTSNPVVIAATQTNVNGANQIYSRGNSLTTSGIQLQVEEDDVTTPVLAIPETIAYAVIGTGTDTLNNLEASSVIGITDTFVSQTFSNSYTSEPIVVAHVNDEAGANPFYAVTEAVTTSNFQLAGEESASQDGGHTTEGIGWVAMPLGLIYGTKYASLYPTSLQGNEEANSNFLKNTGTTNMSGYVLMQVYRNSTNQFVSTQVDDSNTQIKRTISFGKKLDLSTLWNSNPWNTGSESAGYYKIVAWFTDANGNYLLNDSGQNITYQIGRASCRERV